MRLVLNWVGLALLLFAALERLETLHDGAVGQALLVLDRGHAAVPGGDVVPGGRLVLVLGRFKGQADPTPIVRVVLTAPIGVFLKRLNNGGARWNQI